MKISIHRDLNAIPQITKPVLTTGSFDGVHKGHLEILKKMRGAAAEIGGETVLITFDPHPREVINPSEQPPKMLSTIPEKFELLERAGIDHVVIVPFDRSFAALEPTAYISEFLVKNFKPAVIVAGHDHHFGAGRKGRFVDLQASSHTHGYTVAEIPARLEKEVAVSSTKIRSAIREGDFKTAFEFLGYHYFFSGTVVEGNKLGRTIGYPTANLRQQDDRKLMPPQGVYAVDVHLNERRLTGMMNIGVRPTVGGSLPVTEVHIFDFDEEIYGENLRITIKAGLRKEIKFNGLEALKAQLKQDEADSRRINPRSF